MNSFPETLSWRATSLTALASIAETIMSTPSPSRIYLLDGPMGSGKTTLTGKIIRFLGSSDQVQSPTYGLVHEYSSAAGPLYHFDFYRIKTDEEALDIGFEEYLDKGLFCFIEWSEKVSRLLPQQYNRIQISIEDDLSRLIELRTAG